ncbi:UNVERIFIED_CONTAM: hypothetical protein FKN15_067917 [Acipenser sinensis]
MKVMSMLQKEKDQLAEQAEKLGKAVDQEKEMCAQVKKDYRDILNESQTFKDENEEIKKKYENATSRILELENDLIGELQEKIENQLERVTEGQSSQGAVQVGVTRPVLQQYPISYSPENLPATLVAVRPPEMHYRNSYSTQHKRGGVDGTFSPDQVHRPPIGTPSWDSNVVCIQPARNLNRPDGLEDSEELSNVNIKLS